MICDISIFLVLQPLETHFNYLDLSLLNELKIMILQEIIEKVLLTWALFTNTLQTSAGKGPTKYPLQWFLHRVLRFYPLVSLLDGGTYKKCYLPV